MKQKNLILISLMLAVVSIPAAAQDEEKVDLKSLYKQIDEAIGMSDVYVSAREKQIKKLYDVYTEAADEEQKLMTAEELFALYKPFKNDSALHYAQICISLGDSLGHHNLSGRYRSLMARQCSNAGMYVESLGLLNEVNKDSLDRQGLTDYYNAWMHVCGEIAVYSLIPEVKVRYFAMQENYRDSVLALADKGSDEYLHLQMSVLCARKQYQDALKVSSRWLNKVQDGTHADAYASYYRHIVYSQIGNDKMVRYWLAKSALDDIKCAVMDQAALITLAEQLNHDGDIDRSYRYIRFTWQCNDFFNTRLRSTQIAPVLNLIDKSYQESKENNTRLLIIAAILFTILSILLLILFVKVLRQKLNLTQAHSELMAANNELAATNKKLTWMNEKVMKNNKQLFEINHELQEKIIHKE